MAMGKLYFTRHGETDWNNEMKIQGRIDIPLNEKGIAQAKELAEKLEDTHLDLIICSPLTRARQTAEIVNEHHRLPIETDKRILEEFYGDFEGAPRSGNAYHNQRRSFFKRYPNGEGYLDVCARVYSFLDELYEKHKDEDVLVIAHGGMSRLVNSYFMDMENDEFTVYGLANCELKIYSWDEIAKRKAKEKKSIIAE